MGLLFLYSVLLSHFYSMKNLDSHLFLIFLPFVFLIISYIRYILYLFNEFSYYQKTKNEKLCSMPNFVFYYSQINDVEGIGGM